MSSSDNQPRLYAAIPCIGGSSDESSWTRRKTNSLPIAKSTIYTKLTPGKIKDIYTDNVMPGSSLVQIIYTDKV